MGVIYTFELLLELQHSQLAIHKVQHYVDSRITSWDDKTQLEIMVKDMWMVPPDDGEVNDVMLRSKTRRVLSCMLVSEITVEEPKANAPQFKDADAPVVQGKEVVQALSKG